MKQFEINVEQDNRITCVDDELNEVSIPLDSIVSVGLYHKGKQKFTKKWYYVYYWADCIFYFFFVVGAARIIVEFIRTTVAGGSYDLPSFDYIFKFFVFSIFVGAIMAALPTRNPKRNTSFILKKKIKHMETNQAGLIIKYSITLGRKESFKIIKVPIIITDYVLVDSDEYKAQMQQVDEVHTKLASLNPAIVLDQKRG